MGGIDVVVQAAGTAQLGRIEELDAETWLGMLSTNVVGPAIVISEALAELRKAENPTVALLSTHTVGEPWPSMSAYAATKAALEELGRGFRVEEPRLRTVVVRVGNTATSFADAWDPGRFERAFGEWVDNRMMRHRVMSAEDVANGILGVIADPQGRDEVLVRGEEEPAG